ncbi:PstS family phosphate ABC transporter substrate-binding protein [Pedobacter xixiisoli]|uniref:Phosphate ABC transporter substrate-binding protein, PhoT family n=1 Tax=Pedobacter xixiisoli TaxID=1476464 RepID=A0A286ADZ6_9SPHI|nr:substrate-binding domain-containing protein [Pedobacter xixiisoli]SOD20122.1 phosphate ABC transporter substrate-binding protein, PhoT family [Pedobacter xixiisoli]
MRITLSLVLTLFFAFAILSCKRKTDKDTVSDTRTSGKTTILVDETYARILDDQIEVFKSDYPSATVNTIAGNENEIMPRFRKGEVKMLVLSRMLKPTEDQYYKQKQIRIHTDRFAIDGLALIANNAEVDSTITVQEAYDIMRGDAKNGKKLVFDNAYSSTIRYFIDSAGIKELPKVGVYTLKTTDDVIKYVADNKGYVGVIGVNWLLKNVKKANPLLSQVKTLAVKNLPNKKGGDAFYRPTQENLINGKYPFLRNVYIINAEGTNGLGTGFATWLASPRGQLIVLKSGLGPHKVADREFNFKN